MFATNASLLSKSVIRKLLELKVDDIGFSLDTLDAEKYRSIRGVNLFRKVKGNIESFLEERNGDPLYKKNVYTTIQMVVTDETIEELPSMIGFTHE